MKGIYMIKYIINSNVDKIMKIKIIIKMIKSLQTSTNSWLQKLLSSLTHPNNSKNTKKWNQCSRTTSEIRVKQLQEVIQ